MTSYTKIIEAVRDGKPSDATEKDYALVLAHHLLMKLFFEGKKVITLDTSRVRDTFEQSLDSVEDYLSRDLETLIKGSSMEPGISREERNARGSKSIAQTAGRLHDALTALK